MEFAVVVDHKWGGVKEIGVWMSRNKPYAEKPGLQSRAEFLFADFVTGTLGPGPFQHLRPLLALSRVKPV